MSFVDVVSLVMVSTFYCSLAQQPGTSCTRPIGPCLGGSLCQPPRVCVQDGIMCCAPGDVVPMTIPPPAPSTAFPPPATTGAPATAAPSAAPSAATTAPATAATKAPVTAPPPVTVVVPTTRPSGAACADLINPSTGVSDCPNMAYYCKNPNYLTLMVQQCPLTCGFCSVYPTTPSNGNGNGNGCVDKINPTTGVSDCPGMASYCNNANYYAVMTQQCPRTCGRCGVVVATTQSSNTCVDLINPTTGVSDCPSMATYCNNAAYYNIMTNQCPFTCGRCFGSSSCVDRLNPNTGVSDCPAMVAYCRNNNYASLMKQQCSKTCGFC